jgi:hypothetical protein
VASGFHATCAGSIKSLRLPFNAWLALNRVGITTSISSGHGRTRLSGSVGSDRRQPTRSDRNSPGSGQLLLIALQMGADVDQESKHHKPQAECQIRPRRTVLSCCFRWVSLLSSIRSLSCTARSRGGSPILSRVRFQAGLPQCVPRRPVDQFPRHERDHPWLRALSEGRLLQL